MVNHTIEIMEMYNKELQCDLKQKKINNNGELVYIPTWLRGIGKTYALVQFAKKYDYAVVLNLNISGREHCGELREKYGYNDVFGKNVLQEGYVAPSVNKCYFEDGIRCGNGIVIDEGLSNTHIKKIKQMGGNIVTGYTNNIDYKLEKKESADIKNIPKKELIIENLYKEIELLSKKVKEVREREDYGTYKNLIHSYESILRTYHRYTEDRF